jgi:hypothetical protein
MYGKYRFAVHVCMATTTWSLGFLLSLVLLCAQAPAPTAGSTAALKYRTLRLAHSIRVFPLLLVRPTVASSPADLSAHLLRLDMEGSRVSGLDAVTTPWL